MSVGLFVFVVVRCCWVWSGSVVWSCIGWDVTGIMGGLKILVDGWVGDPGWMGA